MKDSCEKCGWQMYDALGVYNSQNCKKNSKNKFNFQLFLSLKHNERVNDLSYIIGFVKFAEFNVDSKKKTEEMAKAFSEALQNSVE